MSKKLIAAHTPQVSGSRKHSPTGVVLHQPLNRTIFWFLAVFRPKNERDSCIPPPQKRRTPLPGDPQTRFFRPYFWPKFPDFGARWGVCGGAMIYKSYTPPHSPPWLPASQHSITHTSSKPYTITIHIQLLNFCLQEGPRKGPGV